MEYESLGSVTLPSQKLKQKRLCAAPSARAKAVYEDANNIGARLLAKQGWTVGQGLGKCANGSVDPIFVTQRREKVGMGFKDSYEEEWSQHDAGFNELLRQLNGNTAGDAEDGGITDPKAHVQSLEELSKNSRARVHYKKFTGGKDLSKASGKDLASIFGKRSLEELNQPKKAVQSGPEEESDGDSGAESQKPILGLTTIKANVSLNEYFRQKMKEKKNMANQTEPHTDNIEKGGIDCVEQEVLSKKKKSKKYTEDSNQLPTENVALEEDSAKVIDEIQTTSSEDSSELKKKKKKSKRNKSEALEVLVEGNRCETATDNDVPKTAADTDADRKDGKRKHEASESFGIDNHVEEGCNEPRAKKKKTKKGKSNTVDPLECDGEQASERLNVDTGDEKAVEKVEPELKKKKGKSKKIKQTAEQLEENAATKQTVPISDVLTDSITIQSNEEMSEGMKKPKKKKKKELRVDPETGSTVETEPAATPDGEGENGKQAIALVDTSNADFVPPAPNEAEPEEDVTCKVRVDVLKHVDETAFPGSNFGNIVGYRLTEDVTLISKEPVANRMLERHRFHMKTETVSELRKWQKLKKVHAFTPI